MSVTIFIVSSDTLYILQMLFFVCVYLLFYRCDGHATIFIFNLNSFHVHVLRYIVLPTSPFFCPLLSNLFSMYADLGKNKMTD